jgi:DNA-directed RNA polymerase specialized sigma24 family protein
MVGRRSEEAAFEGFVREVEPRLRRAFVAAYGVERGREATAEALGWAWSHWRRVREMSNAAGYLYRVGQSRTRRRRDGYLVASESNDVPWIEPRLRDALAELSERQRVAVVLVHGFGWSSSEVAALLGIKPTTVQTHVERGLARLRAALEVYDDA